MGFDPRIVKPETGQSLSWCKRMSRARPVPSFEDVLENEVTGGLLTQKESIKRSYEVR